PRHGDRPGARDGIPHGTVVVVRRNHERVGAVRLAEGGVGGAGHDERASEENGPAGPTGPRHWRASRGEGHWVFARNEREVDREGVGPVGVHRAREIGTGGRNGQFRRTDRIRRVDGGRGGGGGRGDRRDVPPRARDGHAP